MRLPTALPDHPTTPALQLDELAFGHDGHALVRGWTRRIPSGLTWVRGDHGSGKTTLLRLLAGELAPQHGRLQLQGVADAPAELARHAFWQAPDPIDQGDLLPAAFWDGLARRHPTLDRDALARHLGPLGLTPHLEKRIEQLSTGTRRKLVLAAALAAGTPVVVLDEPLAALDGASVAHVLAMLAEAAHSARAVWVVTSHVPLDTAVAGPVQLLDLDALRAG